MHAHMTTHIHTCTHAHIHILWIKLVIKEEEEDEEAAKNEATPTTAPPPPAANNMYTAEQKLVKGTSAVPPRPNDTPFQLESTMSITEPKPGQFYECGVETFAGFTSSTYDGWFVL